MTRPLSRRCGRTAVLFLATIHGNESAGTPVLERLAHELMARPELLAGKRALRGRTTAYVCVNRVCKYPTDDPSVFAEQLRAVQPIE